MPRPDTYNGHDLDAYQTRMGYACYVLVHEWGYTQSEAGRILGIAQNTVSRHLSRYLANL